MSTRFALFTITATRFTARFNTRCGFYAIQTSRVNSPIRPVIIELFIDNRSFSIIKNLFAYIFSYWKSILAIFLTYNKIAHL